MYKSYRLSNDPGPMMLLELCDMSLKDWLENLSSISLDDTENMLTFALNIARGVEHLHASNPKVGAIFRGEILVIG